MRPAGFLRAVGRAADSEALQADATNRVADVLATIGVLLAWWVCEWSCMGGLGCRAAGCRDSRARGSPDRLALGDILMDRAPAGLRSSCAPPSRV